MLVVEILEENAEWVLVRIVTTQGDAPEFRIHGEHRLSRGAVVSMRHKGGRLFEITVALEELQAMARNSWPVEER